MKSDFNNSIVTSQVKRLFKYLPGLVILIFFSANSWAQLASNPTAIPGVVCAGDNVQLDAVATGGSLTYTYTWTSVPVGFTSTLANPTANPLVSTQYNVLVDDGATSVNATVAVTVNPLPSVTFSALSNVCIDASSFALAGGLPAGGTYSGTGVSAGSFSPVTAGVGTHLITYTYTDGNLCVNSASQNITVNALPTVTLGALTDVCIDASSFALTGGLPAGGTYTGTGVSAGNFSPAAAGAGTHTITYSYTDGNSCTNTATQNITVNALPAVSFAPLTDICLDAASFTLSGGSPAGGTYSGTGVSLGSFFPAAAGLGSHIITYTYTDGNSCVNSATQSIGINPLPTATVSGSTTVCRNAGSPMITFAGANGTAPYTFTYTINGVLQATVSSGITATVSVPTTTPGTFDYELVSVQDASTTTCDQNQTGIATVIVRVLPTATIAGGTAVCLNEAFPDITFTGANGTAPFTFTYNVNGGADETVVSSGNTATVSAPTTTSGVFNYNLVSVQASGGTNCSQSQTGSTTVTVNSLPTATIGGTLAVCQNATYPTITFTGANGTSPYTFTYNINGGAPQTVVSSGNIATVSAPTTASGVFNYNLVSVQDASTTTCSQTQSETATITVNSLPTAAITGNTAVCQNATSPFITFTGDNGTAPYTFTYTIDGGAPQTVVSSGPTATVSVPTSLNGTYIYSLVSVLDNSSTACSQSQTGIATVIVNPLPTATVSVNTTEVCQNGTSPVITFTGANGTAPYTFTYSINGTVQTPVSSGAFATVNLPTTTSGTFVYALVSVRDASSTSCSQGQTGSVSVVVNSLPTATISGATEVCQNATSPLITFTGANGTAPYTFSYTVNGTPQTLVSTGTSATVSVPTTTSGTIIYSLVSVQDASTTSCSQNQSGSVTVIVNPLPTATISGTIDVCQNEPSPLITFSGASGTAPYFFTYTINGTLQPTVSSGASATVSVPTLASGTFTYALVSVRDNSSTSCSQAQSGSATVIVNPLPTATISGTTAVCQNDAFPLVSFTGANGTAPYIFSYNIDGGSTFTVSSGAGNTVSIFAPTGTAGNYTYNLLSVQDGSSTTCTQTQTGSATITVYSLPNISASSNSPVCAGSSLNLIGGPAGMTTYSWVGPNSFSSPSQNPIVSSTATAAMAGGYTLTVINSNGCQNATSTSVTINPLPIASTSNNGPVCVDSPLSLTGGPAGMTTYIWNGPDGFISTVQSPTVSANATLAMAGVYNLSIVNSNGCQDASASTVIVNPLPTATINGTTVVCRNDFSPNILFTGGNGTAPYTFTYTINGGGDQTVTTTAGNSVNVAVPTGAAGSFIYSLVSVRDASSSTCLNMQTGIATVTVNPLPTATIGGTTAVCNNDISPNITFTGASGTAPYTFTYTINGSGSLTALSTGNIATVAVPTGTPGTYTYSLLSVRDASSTACVQAQTGTAIVTVNPLPAPTASSNGPVCAGSSLSLTGGPDAMTAYSWTGPNSFSSALQSPTVSSTATAAMAGVYTLGVTNANGCQNTTTTTVVVNPLPVATASSNSPVCASSTLSLTGGPAGMTTYAWTGPNSYTSSQQSPTISSSASLAMAGLYNLLITNNNGCQSSVSTTTIVNPLPTASIGGTTVLCKDSPFPNITFSGGNGTAPYTFSYNINGIGPQTVTTTVGNNVTVQVPTGNAGTYTYTLLSVRDASSTACTQNQSGSAVVTINPLPSASISGTTAVCRDDLSPNITLTGSNGSPPYTFTYTINSGSNQTVTTTSGNSISIVVPTNTAGAHTYSLVSVQDASATSCSQAQGGSATVTVNPLPTATITGTTEVCRDAPALNVTFTGGNGTAPYTFSYNINGGTIQTASSTGNIATVSVPTNTQGTFTYNLISVLDASSTACAQTQSGSAIIIVNPLPAATISGTTSVCKDGTYPVLTFTGSNGTEPYTFVYTINSSSNQTIQTSTGNSVTVPVPTGTTGVFTYSLVSVRDASSTSCVQTQSGSATVTINPLPTATISGTTAVCQNAASPIITFAGAAGTAPYTFSYRINGGTTQFITTSTGNNVTVIVPTTTPGTYTYTLLSVVDASSSSCVQAQTGSAVVTVNPLPTATISGTTTICQNASPPNITFTGASGQAPYEFSYNINGGTTQTISTSTGNSVTLAVPTATANTFTYNLISVQDASSTACINAQTGNAIVTVNPLPLTSAITGSQTPACSASGISYSVSLTSGSSYLWSVPTGATIISGATGPNNNSIVVNFGANNGNVSVIETLPTGCIGLQRDLAISLLGCALDANFSASATSLCNGSSITFTNLSTGISVNTNYGWNFGAGASPSTGIGSGPHVVSYTGVGTKTIRLIIEEGNEDTLTRTDYITVNPNPTASISGTAAVCRDAVSPVITFSGANGTIPYTFTYNINGGSSQTVTTTVGNTVTVAAPTATAGTFTYNLISVQDASSSACVQAQTGTAAVTVNPLPTATITGTNEVCRDATAPDITFTGANGTFPYTFTFNINGGANQTIATTSGSSVTIAVATGTPGTFTYNLISVQDASSTSCVQTQTGSAVVSVNPLPTASISGTTAVCKDAASPNITFTGATGTAPYTFSYTINSGSIQTVTTTVGNSVTVGAPTIAAGTYTYALLSVQDASNTACVQGQTGEAIVTVNPLPFATIGGTTEICKDDGFPIILFTGTNGTAPYTFTYNVNGGGNQTITSSVNTATISVPSGIAGAFTYNLLSVRDASTTSCVQAQTGSAVVTINPLPTATISGTTAVCRTATSPNITFTGANGTAPYNFTYTINSGSPFSVTTISGNSVSVPVPTGSVGGFTYALVSVQDASLTACLRAQTGGATVIVNPLPVANILGTTEVCRDGASPSVSFIGSNGTAPYTFSYNINGGSVQNVTTTSGNTVTVTVPTSTAGTFTYSLESIRDASSTACSQAQTGNAIVTINPLPTANISGTTAVCRDAVSPNITFTGDNGTAPYTFTYTINSGSTRTVTTSSGNSVTVPVPTDLVATYTYSLVSIKDGSSTACTQTQAGSATVTINPLPTASINGTTAVCKDGAAPNVSFTGASGVAPYTFTYRVNGGITQSVTTSLGSSVSVPAPTGTAGTYTYALTSVQDASTTACVQSQTGSAVITVNPLPTAIISGATEVCRNSTFPNITFTGTDGTSPYTFTFTINGGSNQLVTTTTGNSVTVPVPTGTTGVFTYTLSGVQDGSSTACLQAQTGSAVVRVNPLPTATISGTTAVCQDAAFPNITFTGASGTEPYTFSYRINGGANLFVTTTIGNSITVPVPSLTPGTYTYTLLSVVDASSSACDQAQTGSAVVTVNPLPTATISGTTAICQNATPPNITFTGASGQAPYEFSYNINGGAAQTISTSTGNSVTLAVPTSTANTFTYNLLSVHDASSTACIQAQSGTATITVNPLPVSSAITGSQTPACGASGISYSVSLTSGSSYSWSVPTGTFITSGATGPNNNSITVNFGTNNGNISLIETLPTGCVGLQRDLAISLQGCDLDANFSASSTSLCNGSSITFTNLSTGISGATTYGWNFGAGASPSTRTGAGPHVVSYTGVGTKTVILTILEGASDTETKTNYITVNPLPTATITGTTAVCRDAASPNITFSAANGSPPYTFTYNINGGTNQTITSTVGANVTVGAPTATAGTYNYNLVSVQDASSSACVQAQTGSVVITVNPLPAATISGTMEVCKDASTPNITFTGANGTAPYTFTYNINGGTSQSITTTSGSIVTLAVATGTPGTYSYNLISVRDASSTSCVQTQTGSAIVRVNPLPTASISGTTAVCRNAALPNITFTGANGTAPYTFTYNINSGTDQTVTTTVGNSVTVGAPTNAAGTFTYALISVQDASNTACIQGQTGGATITVNPLPTATIGGTTSVCRDAASPLVTFTGAAGVTPYTFTYNINGGSNQTIVTSTGNSVTIAVPTGTAGPFSYNLISIRDASSTTCVQAQTGSAVVTVNPLPTASISGTTAVCRNATSPNITFTGGNGSAPYTFTYTINSSSPLTVSTSTGNTVTVPVVTGSVGTFTYALVSVQDASSTACVQAQTGGATVTVNPLPNASILGTTAVCRDGASPSVSFIGSNGTSPYTFSYNINGGSVQNVTTLVGVNSISISAPTGTSGTFNYNLLGVQDASSTACIQGQTGSAIITVNPLPTATISGTSEVCRNASSPNITFTGANGTSPYTFTYTVNGGSNQTITTTTGNSVSISVSTATIGIFTYTLTGVQDGSSTSCLQTQTGTAFVRVNPLPTAIISGSTAVCRDAAFPNLTFTGASGTEPYTFTYKINGGSDQTITTVIGNTVTLPAPTTTAGTFTYSLQSILDASNSACLQAQTGNAVITVNPLPTASISGSTQVCNNAPSPNVTFTGSGGVAPYNFTYSVNGGSPQSISTSTGSSVSVTAPTSTTGTFVYALISVQDASATTCVNTQNSSATIIVNPLPVTSGITGIQTPACGQTGVSFSVSLSSGSSYAWTVPTGSVITSGNTGPDNNSIIVDLGTVNGNISVIETLATGCSGAQVDLPITLQGCALIANFSASSTNLCNGSSITFSDISTGVSGLTIYDWDFGAGASPLTANTVGPHIVSYTGIGTKTVSLTIIQGASSTEIKTNYISVNPNPTATISGTTDVCKDASSPNVTFTGANGTSPYTFTYNLNGGTNQIVTTTLGSSVSIPAATATAGTYNYNLISVQDASSSACTQAQTGTAVVTVNPLPTATISGTADVCRFASTPGITFTGANGTAPYTFTYTINGGGGQTITTTSGSSTSIFAPTGTVGTFTYELLSVKDGSSTSCVLAQTGSAVVTVNPLPTASISGTTAVCRDAASPNITFTGANGTAPYTFTYNINSGTSQTITTTIGNSVTVGVATGSPGTFTYALTSVQDASSTTCVQSQAGGATVTVNQLPTATISGTDEVCKDDAFPDITFTGANGIAPYTFTYNINGGGNQTVVTTSGNSVNLAVPTGLPGSFTYSLISVHDASSTACVQSQTGNAVVTINPLPTATIGGTTAVCRNSAQPIITFTGGNGTAPYKFVYTINSGPDLTVTTSTGNTVSVSVPTGTVSTYTYALVSVQDASNTACIQAQTGGATVTVNPLPTASISGTTRVCRDATSPNITFTGGNGTAPYTFTFAINGESSQTVTTTSGNTVSVPAATNASGAFNYELLSVQDASSTACIQPQSGNAVITVNPLPTATVSGTTEACNNGASPSITFTGASGTAPYTFTYTIDGGSNLTVSTTTGSSVSVSAPTNVVGTHTYSLVNVQESSTTNCAQAQTGSAFVTINPLPTATISGTTAVCRNSASPSVTFTGASGTAPYTFNYRINGGSLQSVTTVGVDNVSVSVPTTTAGTRTYTLVSVQDASSTSCMQTQTGSAVITINPLPTATISGTTSVCRDMAFPDITFTGAGGTAPYTFTYSINSGSNQTITTTTGSNVSIAVPTIAIGTFTYSLVGVQDGSSTACLQSQTGSAVITVNPLPTATISGSTVVCKDASSPDIIFTGASGTEPYTFTYRINGGSILTATTLSGNSIMIPASTVTAGTYNYTLLSVQDASSSTCAQAQTGSAVITINPLPTATISGTASVCRDGSPLNITFTGGNGVAPYTFTYTLNGGANQYITTLSGSSISLVNSTAIPGTFSYALVGVQDASTTACFQTQTGTAVVRVNPLPTAIISGSTEACKDGDYPDITFTGASGTEPYTFTYSMNGGSNLTVTTTTGNSVTVSVPTEITGAFNYTLLAVQDGSSTACLQAQTGSAVVIINPLPTATISGNTELCAGDPFPEILFVGAGGISPYTFAYRINSGVLHTIITTTSDSIRVPAPTNIPGIYNYTLISILDASASSCVHAQNGSALVQVYEIPVSDAGDGGFECDLSYTFDANTSVGMGTWKKTSGSGDAIFLPDSNDPKASVNVSEYGNYTFTWTEINGLCSDSSTVDINFYEQPSANPGTGGNSCDQSFALSATPSIGIGTWTMTSGDGEAVFSPSSNAPDAIVNVSEIGSYTFRWTEVNEGCFNSASIFVNFYEQPVADPGPGGNNCGLEYFLNAIPSVGDGTWIFSSGPGTVSFSPDSITPDAIVSVSEYGVYYFTWIEVNESCADSATIAVNFVDSPAADAGPGGQECDLDFDLTGSSSDADGTWSIFSGPGNAVFDPGVNASNSTVTVNEYGKYVFAWTEVNIACESNDTVGVIFREIPYVSAGEDTIICRTDIVNLRGTGIGSFYWDPDSLVNEPTDTVTFSVPDSTRTYHLTLTDEFGCINSDSVEVTVREVPVANAGEDFTTDYWFTAALDARLEHEYESGVWSIIKGSGVFMDTTFMLTEVTNMSVGENIFLWAVSNDVCPIDADSVKIIVKDLQVSTLMTPNSDGKNDALIFPGIENLIEAELIIFDRNGNVVFKDSNYQNDWVGVDYNGNPLPDDTYFYILKGKNGVSQTSYIVIRR